MQLPVSRVFKIIFAVFIFINLAIFAYTNTRPISWLQDEMSCYRFFWSMDSSEKLTLHSGFTTEDWAKPLVSRYTVGAFRPRQISSLFEMVTFKLGQFAGLDYFRDYSLIALHLLNVFLFWLLIRRISGSRIIASMMALLMLNAGAAMATLFFPFRAAKILVITFFLFNWNLIVSNSGQFNRAKPWILVLFSAVLLSSFFIDETFLFLCPVYFVYLWLYQGREAALSRRLWMHLAVVALCAAGLGILFYEYSNKIAADQPWHGSYVHHVWMFLSNPLAYRDVAISFWSFISRNFGYWGFTFWGAAAFVSVVVMLHLAEDGKHQRRDLLFAVSLLAVMFLKALLMPHLSVHPHIMPAGTVFPSMLFFSYYYVYVESFLVMVVLALLLYSYRQNVKVLIILMSCVTVINLSNMFHAPKGIESALKYHGLDDPRRELAVENIQALKKVLSVNAFKPLYVSFPAGNDVWADGRFGFDATWPVYTSYILTMFVPSLEKGEAIISLKNAKPRVAFSSNEELLNARAFYDVPTRDFVDLAELKRQYGEGALKPLVIKSEDFALISAQSIESLKGDLIFFVKGQSDIQLRLNDEVIPLEQLYGESYRLFRCRIEKKDLAEKLEVQLSVRSVWPYKEIKVVGPFFIAAPER